MKILVVDDSAMMRKLILRALGGADLEVVEAADGVEALAMVQHHAGSIDLVICDMNMPNLNGLSLLRSLRSSHELRQIPFVIVTADESDERIQQALREGAAGVIGKPFLPEEMSALIHSHDSPGRRARPAARQGEAQVKGDLTKPQRSRRQQPREKVDGH